MRFVVPLAITCKLVGSSGLILWSRVGESGSLINLVCSGVQILSCLSTGIGKDLGRNQKGTADRSVTVPATR